MCIGFKKIVVLVQLLHFRGGVSAVSSFDIGALEGQPKFSRHQSPFQIEKIPKQTIHPLGFHSTHLSLNSLNAYLAGTSKISNYPPGNESILFPKTLLVESMVFLLTKVGYVSVSLEKHPTCSPLRSRPWPMTCRRDRGEVKVKGTCGS